MFIETEDGLVHATSDRVKLVRFAELAERETHRVTLTVAYHDGTEDKYICRRSEAEIFTMDRRG